MSKAAKIALFAGCALVGAATLGLESAIAQVETETFQLVMQVPQISRAPNGDQVAITGSGMFSVHPKSVTATGTFTHSDSQGNILGSGTWVATQLLSFQPYGCGVVLGTPINPNACGGKLILRVLLTGQSGEQFEGILSVFCIIGPNPPNSHDDPSEEGARLNIVGVINFNKIVSGANVYIRTS